MRVMYFLAHPESIGGAAVALMTQACIMHRNGCEVKVVIQNNKAGYHHVKFDQYCDEWQLSVASLYYPISTCVEDIDVLNAIRVYPDVENLILDYNPDVIHSVQINPTVELVSREHSIPHIMNAYPISPYTGNIKWDDIYAHYHCADTKKYCMEWNRILGVDTRTIRGAYELDDCYIPEKTHEHRYEFICMGVFVDYKKQLNIIRFIERCIDNGLDVYLEMIGNADTDYGRECLKYIDDNKLQNAIKIIGFTPCIEPYLAGKDLLIHASDVESYPTVIIEAMCNRVPVMINRVGGIDEIVKDCENGFLMEGNTVEKMYESFQKYLKFKENGDITKIIENGFDTYEENHSYCQIGKQLQEYYEYVNDNLYDLSGKKKFDDISKEYLEWAVEKKIELTSEFTKERIWLLKHLYSIFKDKSIRKVLIWGAGLFGTYAIEWCQILDVNIVGYIDSSKKGEYMGYSIYEPDEGVKKDADAILVALGNYAPCKEVCNYLEEIGMTRNDSYFLMQNNPCL